MDKAIEEEADLEGENLVGRFPVVSRGGNGRSRHLRRESGRTSGTPWPGFIRSLGRVSKGLT